MTKEEREFYDNVTLQLNVKEFEVLKKKALEVANKKEFNEEKNSLLDFDNLNFEIDCEEFKDGEIILAGNIIDSETKKVLGWLDIKVDLTLDRVLELVQYYMKKLGKLKTVLEATKDE